MKINMQLVKAAQKSGGDRYESKDGLVIYFPQSISRPDGKSCRPEINITVE